jgi:hypothetical protein
LSGDSIRVPLAVNALMMMADYLRDFGLSVDVREDAHSNR